MAMPERGIKMTTENDEKLKEAIDLLIILQEFNLIAFGEIIGQIKYEVEQTNKKYRDFIEKRIDEMKKSGKVVPLDAYLFRGLSLYPPTEDGDKELKKKKFKVIK